MARDINKLVTGQQFGHFRFFEYPKQFLVYDNITILDHGYEDEFLYMIRFKTHLLDRRKQSILVPVDYTEGDIFIEFRIPKVQDKYRIGNKEVEINLPPVEFDNTMFSWSNGQRDDARFPSYSYIEQILYPLTLERDERLELIKKLIDITDMKQLVIETNKIMTARGHLVFDVTTLRAANRPISIVGEPQGVKFSNIHLRIWIKDCPFYIF